METAHTNPFLNFGEKNFINHFQIEALLENIPRLIYMKDTKGNYLAGTSLAREFAKNGKDIVHNVQIDIEKIKKTNYAEDEYVISNNKSITNEREIPDISGMLHCYRVYKAPIRGEGNKIIGIVVMADNIDASKLLEAQRETFVASLGHDLKNPTIAQIRMLELLLKDHFGKIEPEQRGVLEMTLDSCKYMKAMLGSMLVTYRNDRGIVRLNYEEMSLISLVNECVEEMKYIAEDKDVKISMESEQCILPLKADKMQIKRVIMNLLSNGIKYAFRNSVIKLNVYNEGDYACFKFENMSPFIPLDKRESIFAQYVSYAAAYKELGIGLGLYTSQKIVEAHEGIIFVESYEDNRNIFGFKIPNKITDPDKPRTIVF